MTGHAGRSSTDTEGSRPESRVLHHPIRTIEQTEVVARSIEDKNRRHVRARDAMDRTTPGRSTSPGLARIACLGRRTSSGPSRRTFGETPAPLPAAPPRRAGDDPAAHESVTRHRHLRGRRLHEPRDVQPHVPRHRRRTPTAFRERGPLPERADVLRQGVGATEQFLEKRRAAPASSVGSHVSTPSTSPSSTSSTRTRRWTSTSTRSGSRSPRTTTSGSCAGSPSACPASPAARSSSSVRARPRGPRHRGAGPRPPDQGRGGGGSASPPTTRTRPTRRSKERGVEITDEPTDRPTASTSGSATRSATGSASARCSSDEPDLTPIAMIRQ